MPAATARSSAAPARRVTSRTNPRGRAQAPQRAASRPRAAQPARLVPVAVGRTAVAVGGIPEWGLIHRLTRGRVWIGILTALLVGIVALNVGALSLSAAASRTGSHSDDLKRENSAIRARIATTLTSSRVQREATETGLVVPAPGSIRYLRPSARDALKAAHRLRSGAITVNPTP